MKKKMLMAIVKEQCGIAIVTIFLFLQPGYQMTICLCHIIPESLMLTVMA